jgi:hypothetical protein
MSMEQPDFTALRNLLKLKRHELPPPRYFNDFSTQVLTAIRNGQTGGAEAERMAEAFSWMDRLLGAFQRKPVLAGLFGAAVCGLLVVGITFLERPEPAPTGPGLTSGYNPSSALPQPASVFNQDATFMVSSTNPIIPASGSIFDSITYPGTAPVRLDGSSPVILRNP